MSPCLCLSIKVKIDGLQTHFFNAEHVSFLKHAKKKYTFKFCEKLTGVNWKNEECLSRQPWQKLKLIFALKLKKYFASASKAS